MKKMIEKKASIIWPRDGIKYNVCTLIERFNSDGFSYVFEPNYFVLSLIDEKDFDGIQGINLNKKKKSYERGSNSTFIYERVPPKNRIGINKILSDLGMDYYDPLDIMLKSNKKYCGDSLEICPYIKEDTIAMDELLEDSNSEKGVTKVLQWLASGKEIIDTNTDSKKRNLFRNFMSVYKNCIKTVTDSIASIAKKPIDQKTVGRPKIAIDKEYETVINLYNDKIISFDQAIALTGTSKSTFIRRKKELECLN